MNNFPRYDSYKDSGVDWLGEIPNHWNIRRLASLGRFSKGFGISRAELIENGLPAILYGDIYTKYDISVKNVVNGISFETSTKAKEIRKNHLLFTGSGETIEDIGKCVVYLSDQNAYAGGDVIVFEQSANISLYLSYALNTNGVKCEKAKISKGEIVVHIYASKLKDIFIPIPPIEEQLRIAEFLDRKMAQIDQAISQKERLIELLKERRQILIHNAVTRGLNPNVKFKHSGVDWIGEIPEHWEVKRAKFLFDEIDERSQTGNEELLSVSHLTGVTPRSEKNVNMFQPEDYTGSKLCKKDDLIFNIMWA